MQIKVACHQPNFIPWMGYFSKMLHADVFVLLDDVQFTQGANKHNWTTRVKLLIGNEPNWISIPVKRSGEGLQKVSEIKVEPSQKKWNEKAIKSLELNYKKSPFFQEIFPSFQTILSKEEEFICKINIEIIDLIVSLLGIQTKIVLSSQYSLESSSNFRLIELTRLNGGNTYLSGDGADDYQIIQEFANAGIKLEKLGFKHPIYKQKTETFFPGLSILDSLFWNGNEKTKDLLLQSRMLG
jgi:hypothetical protein